jgi:hypothetical protein
MLKKKEETDEMVVNYSLSDTVFAKAKVTGDIVQCCRRVVVLKGYFQVDTEGGKCCLWIGANTMVEYSYEEAIQLVETQIEQTHNKLTELNEDLSHLRGNSITVEVNMARLFNHSVKLKKIREAAAAGV